MLAIGDSSQQILNRSQQIASSLDVVADYQGRCVRGAAVPGEWQLQLQLPAPASLSAAVSGTG
jgi:hypothetical protein